MVSLLGGNFLLSQGDPIRATVSALNDIDYSVESELSGDALVQIEPHTPTSPITRGDQTSETEIEIVYSFTESDGGATIDHYSIEIDAGLGFMEAAQVTSSPAMVSHADIISGAQLTLRYRAYNVHGYSGYSPTSEIVVATVSTQPLDA